MMTRQVMLVRLSVVLHFFPFNGGRYFFRYKIVIEDVISDTSRIYEVLLQFKKNYFVERDSDILHYIKIFISLISAFA